ncbi:MAG TPA: PqqD family protein [Pyrinomonadaceae bacterium]|nr:PqqD family protein [Pyrinomonadaceae bacterium]
MKRGSNPISRKDNIVIQELNGEILIYDLGKNKVFCLNQTSAMVWQECNGTKSVTEISQNLSKKLKSNVSEDIVWLALNQFKKDNLIEKSESFSTPLDGLSRREIVKRIGFASVIALPIIASVVAPTSINAQSGVCFCGAATANSRPPGCACNANSQCCNNVCGGGGTTCAVSGGVVVGPGCCPGGTCPPANGTNVPPGCGCNGNGNCATNNCINGICAF